GRTNNLVRLLSFVCDKYFAGLLDEVKEYNIAVQALGRQEDFDPQADTIVRVTAHALRKRLEDYYRTTGAHHSVHICLPPGHYVPKFIHKEDLEAGPHADPNEGNSLRPVDAPPLHENGLSPPMLAPITGERAQVQAEDPAPKTTSVVRRPIVGVTSLVVLLALVLLSLAWYRENRTTGRQSGIVPPAPATSVATGDSGQVLRAAVGDDRPPYVDRAGATWES